MLIDLNTFIKCDAIRESLKKDSVICHNTNEVDYHVMRMDEGQRMNLIFETSQLKSYFIDKLKDQDIDFQLVNCNASIERFFEDVNNNKLHIFNNINQCKSLDILNAIQNIPGIFIY